MTFRLNNKRRSAANCAHDSQVTIEIAGMSRSVCEACGRVSVSYVDTHFTPERIQEMAGKSQAKV